MVIRKTLKLYQFVYTYFSIFQAFSEHQLQQMTSNFIDTFGFNDEEFVEQDDKIE